MDWVPMADDPNSGLAMTAPAQTPALMVDVVIDNDLWRGAVDDAEALCRQAIETAAAEVPGLSGQPSEVTVLLTGDARLRELNAHYRGKDKATNVLSFPSLDDDQRAALSAPIGSAPAEPLYLGDIAIAFETLDREARAEDKPFVHHLTHLVVHGFLHLVGYDHEVDDEAAAMETLERRILAGLDIPDPYSL